MSVPVVTFFNNKGGVGKTSLVYHLSWMFGELGKQVVAVDLDPQANLTAAFLSESQIEDLWQNGGPGSTVYRAVEPLTEVGDLLEPDALSLGPGLTLLPGDVALSSFEETLSAVWPDSMNDQNLYRPFRILTAFWQVAQLAARRVQADLIVMDVGPHLGAINRSALIGSDYVVIPLGADLFSLKGLENLGPTLRSWRSLWQRRRENWAHPAFELPAGAMQPIGYVVQQHGVRLSRPVRAYDRWIRRVPGVYRRSVLGLQEEFALEASPQDDPHCLATVKHYRSLLPMSQESRKPVFQLAPADGAIGSHAAAVREAYYDFKRLAEVILDRIEQADRSASHA